MYLQHTVSVSWVFFILPRTWVPQLACCAKEIQWVGIIWRGFPYILGVWQYVLHPMIVLHVPRGIIHLPMDKLSNRILGVALNQLSDDLMLNYHTKVTHRIGLLEPKLLHYHYCQPSP
jgi:hypothetical protein